MSIFKNTTSFYLFTTSLLLLISILIPGRTKGGPPFLTDDPEPVEPRHWEYYISSINLYQPGIITGTLPHFEVNYGPFRNIQFHVILPFNFDYTGQHVFHEGYGDTELGIKYRFIQENDHLPQVGTFPMVEVPTIQNREFTNGKVKVFIPVWLQKSWGRFTTYGGAGYWVNPGTGNKNWTFAGWEAQYDFTKKVTLGGELYYQTAASEGGHSSSGFNLGGLITLSEKMHFIFSAGHSISGSVFFTSYAGLLFTI